MAENTGKQLTCDRCGDTIFLKRLERVVVDGGYDSYDKYEDAPKKWLYDSHFGHLCPSCADQFRYFVTIFMDDNVAPGWKYIPEEEDNA